MMRRTVHRLEAEVVLAGLAVEDQEHVLPVLAPVPALLPERLVVEERGLDLLVAVFTGPAAHPLGEHLVEDRALGAPEGGARGLGEELEQVELPPQLAVVPLPRLLLLLQPGVEVLLVEE